MPAVDRGSNWHPGSLADVTLYVDKLTLWDSGAAIHAATQHYSAKDVNGIAVRERDGKKSAERNYVT